LDKLG